MGAGLLDDHQRVGARRDPGVVGLGVEPGDNQLAQRGLPYVAVTVREEVAGLLALDLVEDGELRVRIRGRPRERDRPPDAEVVAERRPECTRAWVASSGQAEGIRKACRFESGSWWSR